MQYSQRKRRNFETVRINALLYQNRAGIKGVDGSTHDLITAVQFLTKNSANNIAFHSDVSSLFTQKHPQSDQLEQQLSHITCSDQMLFSSMLLPASLLQTISLFLPLPTLWKERWTRLDDGLVTEDPAEKLFTLWTLSTKYWKTLDFYRRVIPHKYQRRYLIKHGRNGSKTPSPARCGVNRKLKIGPRAEYG
jgi:hypothetical protein